MRGEFKEWQDRWETSSGARDNLWGALLRSPMMAGSSSMLTDVALSSFGRAANDLTGDLTGVRPLRTESSKFKEKQGFAALLGPAAGFAVGTVPALGNRLLDGELDEARDMAARRTPVLNVFYLQMLNQLGE